MCLFIPDGHASFDPIDVLRKAISSHARRNNLVVKPCMHVVCEYMCIPIHYVVQVCVRRCVGVNVHTHKHGFISTFMFRTCVVSVPADFVSGSG